MKRLLWLLLLPLLVAASALPARAQLANARGWCEAGAQVVVTSGLNSSTTVQASFPLCLISVSIHGGGVATIFSDGASTPLSNPFTSQTNGQWIFYAANGEYDITMTGAGLPAPVLYSDVFIIAGGGAGGLLTETNGTPNTSQSVLNLVNGSGVTITNTSGGNVTISSTGGGSGITCTTAQILFGTGATTAGCDPNFSWNNSTKIVNIGPTGNPSTTINGGLNPSGGNGIISIYPNAPNGYTTSFSSVVGNSINIFSGAEGAAATNIDNATLYSSNCGNTNGSRCTLMSMDSSVTDDNGKNPNWGFGQATGIFITTEATESGSEAGWQSSPFEGDATCTGPSCGALGYGTSDLCAGTSCTADGLSTFSRASGTNSMAEGVIAYASCTGVGCHAYALDLVSGSINTISGEGIAGEGLTSQGANAVPIWAGPNVSVATGTLPIANNCPGSAGASATTFLRGDCTWATPAVSTAWSATTAGTNSNAGNFILSGNTWDARIAAHTFPSVTVAASASLPAACVSGELGFVTGSTAGQNLWECNGGVWTQQLNSGAAGMSTSGSNAAATAVGSSWIPGAVNTAALGSNALPWTNVFLGTVANQSGSFNTANLTANRVINIPNATSTPVRDCPAIASNVITAIAVATGVCTQAQLASSDLSDAASIVTATSVTTKTNLTLNAESTGNSLSLPIKAFFGAAGCNNATAGNGFDIGVANAPTPACLGTIVRKGVLQFARGNTAYISWHLPADWNSSAATDIELGFTTTDTTNGHVTSWNIQTACNKMDGTVTDDPALNAFQALSVTTGASQVSGGQLGGTKTALTMTGCVADYNFEVAITRNNSGTDTNTDTAVALKFAEITTGVTKNATNR